MAGRARYYAQLNGAFHKFRQSYGLSTVEMCAFLYDFAPRFLVENKDELPEPSKIWLIIGGTGENGDFEWLEESTEHESSLSHWQENLGTRRGDVLLLYCVMPHSCIHSIWRAMTDGFVDPFFYCHSTVWIGQPVKTVPVTFKEMKADPLLSQKGVIRAHLQGPSGKPFTLEEYDAVLAIMQRKGRILASYQDLALFHFYPLPSLETSATLRLCSSNRCCGDLGTRIMIGCVRCLCGWAGASASTRIMCLAHRLRVGKNAPTWCSRPSSLLLATERCRRPTLKPCLTLTGCARKSSC